MGGWGWEVKKVVAALAATALVSCSCDTSFIENQQHLWIDYCDACAMI